MNCYRAGVEPPRLVFNFKETFMNKDVISVGAFVAALAVEGQYGGVPALVAALLYFVAVWAAKRQ